MSMGSLLLAGGAPGQADVAAERPHPHPPAVGRVPGPGDRHRDPRPRDARAAPAPRRDLRPAHRPAASSASTTTWTATASSPPSRRSSTACRPGDRLARAHPPAHRLRAPRRGRRIVGGVSRRVLVEVEPGAPPGRREALAPLLAAPFGIAGPLVIWPAIVAQLALPMMAAGHLSWRGGRRASPPRTGPGSPTAWSGCSASTGGRRSPPPARRGGRPPGGAAARAPAAALGAQRRAGPRTGGHRAPRGGVGAARRSRGPRPLAPAGRLRAGGGTRAGRPAAAPGARPRRRGGRPLPPGLRVAGELLAQAQQRQVLGLRLEHHVEVGPAPSRAGTARTRTGRPGRRGLAAAAGAASARPGGRPSLRSLGAVRARSSGSSGARPSGQVASASRAPRGRGCPRGRGSGGGGCPRPPGARCAGEREHVGERRRLRSSFSITSRRRARAPRALEPGLEAVARAPARRPPRRRRGGRPPPRAPAPSRPSARPAPRARRSRAADVARPRSSAPCTGPGGWTGGCRARARAPELARARSAHSSTWPWNCGRSGWLA